MPVNFVPLTLGLVEEGALLDDANRSLQKLSSELAAYVNRYGPDRAKGAESSLTIKIKVKYEGDGVYGVEGTCQTKQPGRPVCWTKAIQVDENDGKTPVLMVRQTGSTQGDPHQLHLQLGELAAVKAPEPAEQGSKEPQA